MTKTCYACVGINTQTMKAEKYGFFSEPAWSITRVGDGIEWVELFNTEKDSYQEACNDAQRMFSAYKKAAPASWLSNLKSLSHAGGDS